MKKLLISLFICLFLVTGCSQKGMDAPAGLGGFLEELKANGVEGSLLIREPFNEDMEYVAEYAIARYTSTRIISFFKFKDSDKAEANLEEAMKNDKLSGQARNGSFVMAATFYPPDDEAVEKIRALFLAHDFQ